MDMLSTWIGLGAWGECLRVDYLPNVDIRTVKPKDKTVMKNPSLLKR